MPYIFSLLNFTLSTVLPVLGLVLVAALLGYGLYVRWFAAPQKWLLAPRALKVLCVVAVLCNAATLLQLYRMDMARQDREERAAQRASRERFVLPQDFQYGELLVPAGSLIKRDDPFDKGDPGHPVALHGLEAVRFAQPVQVAGVWASALQLFPLRVELARDQVIRPLHRLNKSSGLWERNPVLSGLACKKGQHAVFHVPTIPYDIHAALGKPAPDGPEARFLPSQWLFRYCENAPPVVVDPAVSG